MGIVLVCVAQRHGAALISAGVGEILCRALKNRQCDGNWCVDSRRECVYSRNSKHLGCFFFLHVCQAGTFSVVTLHTPMLQ